jgi:putative oxidoreductase
MSEPSAHLPYFRTSGSAGASGAAGPLLSPAEGFAAYGHDAIVLVARVLIAYVFLQSGFSKLLDIHQFATELAHKHVPFHDVLGVVAPSVEFVGALAVLLGFQTRYAAGLMILFVIAATAVGHRFWDFTGDEHARQVIHFNKNLCMAGGLLLLVAVGGGRFSIDGLWQRKA